MPTQLLLKPLLPASAFCGTAILSAWCLVSCAGASAKSLTLLMLVDLTPAQ